MPFDLRITFTGLCMFVRDDKRQRLHVVMPSTESPCAHAGGAHEPHTPWLVYDPKYLEAPPGPGERWIKHPLRQKAVELPVPGSGNAPQSPADIVDLGGIIKQRVPGDRLGKTPGDKVIARVTLATGTGAVLGSGVCWEFPKGQRRLLPFVVQWTIRRLDQPGLTLALEGLNNGGGASVGPLNPVDGAIELHVRHVVAGEEEPTALGNAQEPGPGEKAHHFAAYYCLFDAPSETPLPAYCARECPPPGEDCSGGPTPGAAVGISRLGANPFRCMVSRAAAE